MTAGRGDDVAERAPDEGAGDAPTAEVQPTDVSGDEQAIEVARELILDLRAELPRLDARAAAGAALTGALLVGVVTQQSLPTPIYTFGVLAAALLTIALLAFLSVLIPNRNVGRRYVDNQVAGGREGRATRRRASDHRSDAQRLATGLAALCRVEYYTSVVVHMSAQVRKKHCLLSFAFVSGLLAIATLAAGASTALALGYR